MESNKDRQESAIMVFTIVTIVFLPLSFVATIFGMNTKDVRDMPYHQWVYWVTGVPLTVVVVLGSLWWAGELEEIGSWIAQTMSRPKPPMREHEQEIRETKTMRYGEGLANRKDYAGLEEQLETPHRRTTYPRLP